MRPGGIPVLVLAVSLVATGLAPVGAGQLPTEPEPYHNYQTMKEDMQALAEEHSDIATFEVHGTSTAGQEIFHVDVASNISDRSDEELAQLPTLYVDGLHHGNELLSAEATYYFLERVLTNATEDPSYLENKRLVVNPAVNVDGYVRDQRENVNGVDLNRNYPFHWGLYGTSDAPYTGTYRGPSPASETETQVNIELMESLNLYGYVSGHTGTYDLVLPWQQSEDGEMPDWPLYETVLGVYENETGLEYRDPSGAGESPAWAYGNRTAFAILPEVDTEQNSPASVEDVEQRLNEVLGIYRITWENLTHLGGSIHVEDSAGSTLTVHNDGWGPAYNVTAGGETIDEIPAGENVTIELADGADAVTYERVAVPGDSPDLAGASTPLSVSSSAAGATSDEPMPVPAAGLLALVAALAATVLIRRRR